jgi:hypothetical protein
MLTPRAQRDEPGVGRKRFEYPHGALPYGRRPPASGEAGVSLLAEIPLVPTPYSGETHGGPSATASRHQRSWRTSWANRLAGEAGFPSPKGGDILWALLETRHRPRLGAAVGEGTPEGTPIEEAER